MNRLKDLVTNTTATFMYYKNKELWYTVNDFEFPIPIDDTGEGVFENQVKAITLMRWIRKHLQLIEASKENE